MSKAAKPKTKTSRPAATKARRLKKPTYASFRLQKRIKPEKKLLNAFRLTGRAFAALRPRWKTFAGITVVYGLLGVILGQGVRSVSSSGGDVTGLSGGLTVFSFLLGGSTNAQPESSTSQLVLALVASLAVIWALRQTYAGHSFRIRDAFYRGMYPLVPFVLVLLVIMVELLPAVAGIGLFNIVVTNGIAVTPLEHTLWGLLAILLAVLSLYLVCSSIFALYIASLPDMTPMRALRSARELVRYQRWSVIRKLLFLPLMILAASFLVILPFILWATPAVPWLVFILSPVLLPVVHAYMYALYRQLL